jgi:hypothetical protein
MWIASVLRDKKDFVRWVAAAALTTLLTVTLSGCITVNVPEASDSPSSVRPSPSATTFSAEPRETVTEEDSIAEETQEPAETSQQVDQTQQTLFQEVDFTITGGCLESFEQLGYYAIFEEFGDDCYLVVEVFPPTPSRFAKLQYFDSTWVTESSGMTDSAGIVYLEVDQYCDDGYWCDGAWEYRIAVDAEDSLPADRSITFELDFFPEY